jgi:hypothetical protein
VGGLVSTTCERRADAVRACAVAGLPADPAEIARALGLAPGQFGATRGGAIQADIDLPSGFWRVWPDTGIGVWIGRDPDQSPPLRNWEPSAPLELLHTVLRLGEEYDTWLYEGQLHDASGWSAPMTLKAIYDLLRLEPDRFDALSGEFGDSSGRSQTAAIFRSGCVEAISPTQAVRWLSIAYGLNGD